MTRLPLVSLWVLAGVFGAGAVVAEEMSPLLKAPTSAPATPALDRPRAISQTAAAQLAAAAPKYESTPAKPAEPLPDLRETDKPRNTIIRLPSYLVQEDKAPVLKERELLTPKERVR